MTKFAAYLSRGVWISIAAWLSCAPALAMEPHDAGGLALPLASAQSTGEPVVTLFLHNFKSTYERAAPPLAWRDARGIDEDAGFLRSTALFQPMPTREFGARLRLSNTDAAFIKVLTFRGTGPRNRLIRSPMSWHPTLLDRPAGKAFEAGVKLRF